MQEQLISLNIERDTLQNERRKIQDQKRLFFEEIESLAKADSQELSEHRESYAPGDQEREELDENLLPNQQIRTLRKHKYFLNVRTPFSPTDVARGEEKEKEE